MSNFKAHNGWGPRHQPAALSITFDNLGEASWLEMNMWDGPVGQHFTAPFIPKLIQTLGDVRATYFIEASNTALYPDTIRAWAAAGHEVGIHAWRHEAWNATPAARRIDILQRSLAAMRALGIDPVGFRPPGGAVSEDAYDELNAAGFRYISDLGVPGIRRAGELTILPFVWRNVDSYVTEPVAAPLRLMFGDTAEAGSVADWKQALEDTLGQALAEGGQRTVIFHPEFVAGADEKLEMVTWLIARARELDIWIAPAAEMVAFVNSAVDEHVAA